MTITVFEGYSVGEIERGIPLPPEIRKRLSLDRERLIQMEEGDSLIIMLHIDDFATGSARRLIHWARLRGVRLRYRRIDQDSVQVWRNDPR